MSFSEKLEQLAVQLFDIDAVIFGDIEAKVGRKTPIYFDLRVLGSHPNVLIIVSELLEILAADIDYDLVCGVPYAALPIATVLSANTKTPMLMRRKDAKVYGTKKIIEGVYRKNQKCLIIEDVVTSGGSLLETVATLRDHGLTVSDAVVVLDRQQGGSSVLKSHNVTMKSLFTLGELVEMLCKRGKINEKTVKIVLDHITECQFGNVSVVRDNLD